MRSHGVRADQLDLSILYIHVRYTILVYIYVTKIANHSLLIIRSTVVAAKGVENATSSDKALGEITENMDVEAVLARQQTLDSTID